MLINDIRTAIGRALGAIAPDETINVGNAKPEKPTVVPNRTALRRGINHKSIAPREFRPTTVAHVLAEGRVRRRRTGQPNHFRLWMADLRAQQALKSIKLTKLAQSAAAQTRPKANLAKSLTILSEYYPNVFLLAAASLESLLAVPGIGKAKLGVVEEYLRSNNVHPRWSVA